MIAGYGDGGVFSEQADLDLVLGQDRQGPRQAQADGFSDPGING